MKHVYTALNWIFGVLFLLIGLIFLFASTFVGITFIIIALLLIPSVRNFAYSKTKKEIPFNTRAIVIFVLFMSSLIFIAQIPKYESQKIAEQEAQLQAEKAAKIAQKAKIERQKTIDYFNANSDKILSDARSALNLGEYKEVISLSSKYSVTENKELKELNSKAQDEMAAIEKAKKEAQKKAQDEMAAIEKAKKEAQKKAQDEMAAIEKAQKEAHEEAKKTKLAAAAVAAAATAEQEKLKKAQGLSWNYIDSQDKMGRGTIKTAYIYSINTFNFEFPYQGEQRATLRIRVHPKLNKDVILSIEQGIFQCDFNGCTVTVRFDKDQAKNFRAVRSADNDTTTVFIKKSASFYSAAKQSKKIYIEATFYQQGTRVFEFDSADLKF